MDKKKNLLVSIIVLVIAVAAILFVGNTFLNSNNNNEETTNQETNKEENKEESNEENSVVGTYTVKYSENKDVYGENEYRYDESTPSKLTLNDDSTFVFNWNVCSGMMNTTGKYTVKDNKIILSELKDAEKELLETNLNGRTTLEFVVVSNNEIYLDSDKPFACTIHGNKYGSFIK